MPKVECASRDKESMVSVGCQVGFDRVGGSIRLEKSREIRRFEKGDVRAGDDGEVGGKRFEEGRMGEGDDTKGRRKDGALCCFGVS